MSAKRPEVSFHITVWILLQETNSVEIYFLPLLHSLFFHALYIALTVFSLTAIWTGLSPVLLFRPEMI